VSALRQWRVLVAREARMERAGLELVTAVLPLVAAAVLLAGLGLGSDPQLLAAAAPTVVWLVVLTAAVPLARMVAAVEREDDTWDLVRALALPGPLLAAKVTALWAGLATTWLLAAVLASGLLRADLPVAAFAAGLVGTLALAAVTAVFGALLPGGPRGTAVLAGLVLPTGLPALVAGTQAWSAPQPGAWLGLLAGFAAVALAVAWAVFPTVLEE
jgi:heme exporter protein B